MGLSQWKSLLAGSTVTIYYIINSHVEMFIYTLPSVIKAVGVGPVNPVTVGNYNIISYLLYPSECYQPDNKLKSTNVH